MYETTSNRKRKTNKMYEGSDKLYPYNTSFLNDGSWSQKELRVFYIKNKDKYPVKNDSDSSSSWSSDDWSVEVSMVVVHRVIGNVKLVYQLLVR